MNNSKKARRCLQVTASLESDASESEDPPVATSTQRSKAEAGKAKSKRSSNELTGSASRNEVSSFDQTTGSSSSGSTTQRTVMSQELNVDAMHYEKQLEDAAKYFLMSTKELKAVKKPELKKFLKIDCTKKVTKLLRDLSYKMEQKYGCEMVEYVKDKFILVKFYNSASNFDPQNFNFEEPERSKLGLLWLIACCIFMNKDCIYLYQLLAGLKSFGVCDDFMHPELGNVKSLITKDFVRDGFLKIEKEEKSLSVTSSEDIFANAKVFLGARTEAMFDKKRALNYVADVYGNDPKDWHEQYEIIQALDTESSVSTTGVNRNSQVSNRRS